MDMMVDTMYVIVDSLMRKVDDWKEEEEDSLVLLDSMMVGDEGDDNGSGDKGNDEMVVVEDGYGTNDDYDGLDYEDDNNRLEEEVVMKH